MTGNVTEDGREAAVALRLSAPAGEARARQSAEVRAVIDSGFKDWLFVPTPVV